METELLQVREYQKTDWPLVSDWWLSHGRKTILVESLLPPLGVIIERDGAPVMALWLHLSAGVGVAFLENPVMRPGLRLTESAKISRFAVEACEGLCRTHDYGVLICFTLPAIARFLGRQGWRRAGDRVQMVKEVSHGA